MRTPGSQPARKAHLWRAEEGVVRTRSSRRAATMRRERTSSVRATTRASASCACRPPATAIQGAARWQGAPRAARREESLHNITGRAKKRRQNATQHLLTKATRAASLRLPQLLHETTWLRSLTRRCLQQSQKKWLTLPQKKAREQRRRAPLHPRRWTPPRCAADVADAGAAGAADAAARALVEVQGHLPGSPFCDDESLAVATFAPPPATLLSPSILRPTGACLQAACLRAPGGSRALRWAALRAARTTRTRRDIGAQHRGNLPAAARRAAFTPHSGARGCLSPPVCAVGGWLHFPARLLPRAAVHTSQEPLF
jgi:hypothetical protein